ncbi:MAG: methyltransferase [Alphaproteobacteria bacterium]|nr:methyltransferase [Alphaproteobacteria bacterium]
MNENENDSNLITILDKHVQLYQAPGGFRTSMDSVMLAAACPVKAQENVLDLGCGVGSAGLCALYRIDDTSLLGVDIQTDHIDLAIKNAALNNMAERSSFLCADIRDLNAHDVGTFDHVICNPPYKEAGTHKHSPSPAKAQAMGHLDNDMTLRSWIDCAWHYIKGQGSFTIIHEAGQCDSIIHSLYSIHGKRRFGAIEIFPIYTKPEQPAKRVIIRAWKHKKGHSRLLSGITLRNKDNSDTAEAHAVLRDAQALRFDMLP